jgi:hypothetical protein
MIVRYRLAAIALLASLATVAVGGAASAASHATKAQAIAAGWDCNPDITIGGYFHCAQPGKPSLADLIGGAASPPSLTLHAYDGQTERLAGVESLIRADLFAGQPCPQEGSWAFLDFAGADYYACHRFAP